MLSTKSTIKNLSSRIWTNSKQISLKLPNSTQKTKINNSKKKKNRNSSNNISSSISSISRSNLRRRETQTYRKNSKNNRIQIFNRTRKGIIVRKWSPSRIKWGNSWVETAKMNHNWLYQRGKFKNNPSLMHAKDTSKHTNRITVSYLFSTMKLNTTNKNQ